MTAVVDRGEEAAEEASRANKQARKPRHLYIQTHTYRHKQAGSNIYIQERRRGKKKQERDTQREKRGGAEKNQFGNRKGDQRRVA